MPLPNRVRSLALVSLFFLSGAKAASFAPCDDAATDPALRGSQCAVERVPADPSGAAGTGGEIDLFVRKFPAEGASRGNVWLIAGGPGESGASFYGLIDAFRAAFPGFDLLLPDHRGTGFSTRMCPQEEALASAGGTALVGDEWGTCFARLQAAPAQARQFSETNAAHDLKRLLERTPSHGKTYVYGVSYGTQLVLRTVALGAPGIDGIVLDSLVPRQDDDKADLSRRSLVADAVGRQVLAACDASPRCRRTMGEPAEAVYRRVLERTASEPQLLAEVPGKNLKRFFGSLLDVPGAPWQIPYVIKELDEGKVTRLKTLVAEVKQTTAQLGSFPQSPPSVPLVSLISSAENNLQPGRTAQAVREEEAGLLFASSLPGLLVNAAVPLYPQDALFGRIPTRLPRVLVIHGDRDAKTPLDAAERHVEALRKNGPVQVYVATGTGHFSLWWNGACTRATVRKFVLGPQDESRCVSVSSHD
ncbi:alpha/beta hydrolase [Pseudoduganella armeniaca]|nr:alpha/beta hydrolase [Pseudoduganella armeniaca]